jgi:putative acetyltransferase
MASINRLMQGKKNIVIRPIEKQDNASLYRVIRTVFEELNIVQPGTAYFDACLPFLYETYSQPSSAYFVALLDNEIVGGAGVFPTEELPKNTIELVKMYLAKQARGYHIGQLLMDACLEKAIELGYSYVYLETLPELHIAQQLYSKNGFEVLDYSLGNTGHHACSVRMIKQLI